jgi:hypothetical protein
VWTGWVLVGVSVGAATPIAYGRPSPVPTATGRSWMSESGPWGTMRVSQLRLVPPDHVLARVKFKPEGTWVFGAMGWAAVDSLLGRAALTPEQLAALMAPDMRRVSLDGTSRMIQVSDEVRFALSPDSRRIIYDELAAIATNITHALPLLMPSPETMAHAKLNPRVIDALNRLSFSRGARRCVVDADLVEPLAADAGELSRLKRVLLSYPSLSVQLMRESVADRDRVNRYWTKPGGQPSTPLLRAFDRSPEIESIDLIHLLPPLPRKLLHTFPDGAFAPSNANCFWISLNFFNPVPDPRYLPGPVDGDQAATEASQTLRRDYLPVRPPFRFGDVLVLLSETERIREMVHMVVYIADNIVLTKNGRTPSSPFVFMTLGDIEKTYPWPTPLDVRGFRLKPPPSPAAPDRINH